MPSSATHARFITPPTNSSSISAQQQPTQNAPWAMPSLNAPAAPGCQCLRMNSERRLAFVEAQPLGGGQLVDGGGGKQRRREHAVADAERHVPTPARDRTSSAWASAASGGERRPHQQVGKHEQQAVARPGAARSAPCRFSRAAGSSAPPTAPSSPPSSPPTSRKRAAGKRPTAAPCPSPPSARAAATPRRATPPRQAPRRRSHCRGKSGRRTARC